MSDRPTPDWDPRDDAILRDQRRAYDGMRERCPVARSDFLDWSLFRHEDIASVLADPKTYSNASKHRAIPNGMDPPEHTLYRRALEPYFSLERMAAFEPRCRRIAVDLVQPLLARDDVEFVSEFAEAFPLKTLGAFLGWAARYLGGSPWLDPRQPGGGVLAGQGSGQGTCSHLRWIRRRRAPGASAGRSEYERRCYLPPDGDRGRG